MEAIGGPGGNQVYVKKNDCVTRQIAGETIIVPIRGQVGDLESIYLLNGVGTRTWELIDGRRGVAEIGGEISKEKEYEVPQEEASGDMADFLTSLEKAGLIQPC
jgi:hypothetical protein